MKDSKKKIKNLHRKIFIYPNSESDEKAFRICIQNWILHESNQDFEQMLREIIWLRNNKGKTVNYMFFHERHQKIYMDRNFMEWANLIKAEMEIELKKF